jgi:hypothetical protein
VDELRGEIARLGERLARAEERLSRLEITRETVVEILGGAGTGQSAAGREGRPAAAASAGCVVTGGSPIGVVTVPPWRPGLALSVLPSCYRDLLEVLADAGAAAAGRGHGRRGRAEYGQVQDRGAALEAEAAGGVGWPRTVPACSRCPATARRMRHIRPPEGGRALLPQVRGCEPDANQKEKKSPMKTYDMPAPAAPFARSRICLSPWRRTWPAAGPGR